jgi:SAM-dependent methyltransferase
LDLIEKTSGPRHPWERSRAAFFAAALKRALGQVGDATAISHVDVLDCGSGDAYLADHLRERIHCSVTCWDAHYDADTMASLSARYPSLAFTKSRPERAYDVVLMLDVIEHVEDDVAFVRDIVERCLVRDGLVFVSVPAWQSLFSQHDDLLLHHRRYSPRACDRVLEAAGLTIVERGGAFHSLVLPRAVTVARERAVRAVGQRTPPTRESAAATWSRGRLLTSLTLGALRIDNAVSRLAARANVNLPGLSYWAIARRRHGAMPGGSG